MLDSVCCGQQIADKVGRGWVGYGFLQNRKYLVNPDAEFQGTDITALVKNRLHYPVKWPVAANFIAMVRFVVGVGCSNDGSYSAEIIIKEIRPVHAQKCGCVRTVEMHDIKGTVFFDQGTVFGQSYVVEGLAVAACKSCRDFRVGGE